jgi:hypothetical protein
MAGRSPGHFLEPKTRRRHTMAKPKTKRARSRKLNLRDPELKGDVEHFVQILIELLTLLAILAMMLIAATSGYRLQLGTHGITFESNTRP